VSTELEREELVDIYRRLLRIRQFDDEACRLLDEGQLPGAIHTSSGQEGAIVGACAALRDDDYVTGTHRSHGHPIAKGARLDRLMAELLGKETGVCKGKGGSMHLADFAVGSIGQSAIVGGGIPLATGAALAARARGRGQVCLCFFGDGASNQGTFHESLNMAAIWKLPVVYLCENNLYAATTAASDTTAVEDIAVRAAAYAMPGEVVDGQDALAVFEVTSRAVARARRGLGPSLVEAKTYRYREHAEGVPIPGGYRSAEEIERWRRRDPLEIHRLRLIDDGVLDEDEAREIEAQVRAEIAHAVDFACQSEMPAAEAAFEDLYARPARDVDTPPGNPPESPVSAVGVSTVRAVESKPRPDVERQITYFEAIFEAQRQEMERDERVILIGEDIALYASAGLLPDFGPERLRSAPISETGFTGMAVGAAIAGLRPIVDLTIASFFYLAMDPLVHQAAKLRYMSGGQAGVPAVFRAALWHAGSNAGQHSDRPYSMFMNVPGLKIVVPATPYDVKGLLKTAIRDDDPVLVFEDKGLWFETGPVPDGDYTVPLGVAEVKRTGGDVSVVAVGSGVRPALAAAEELAAEGVSVEVIDLRSLVPLDKWTVLQSLAKTGRLLVVDPACRTCGAAAEIAALASEEGFESLTAPVVRVTAPDVHIPFSPSLEGPLYPSCDQIASAIRRQLRSAR